MTNPETVESVLAEMRKVAPAGWAHIHGSDIDGWANLLAAAHAAEVAGLEANLRNLSPLNYEERCRLRDAEARIAELKRVAEDAINLAEAAERDAGMLRDTLRECLPYVDSYAKASHMLEGFGARLTNEHDELTARVAAIATTEQADED